MPKNAGSEDMMGVKVLETTPYFILEDTTTRCGVNLAFENPVQVSVMTAGVLAGCLWTNLGLRFILLLTHLTLAATFNPVLTQ